MVRGIALTVGVTVVAPTLLLACGRGAARPSTVPPTRPRLAAASAAPSAGTSALEVERAYRQAWSSTIFAARTADYRAPALSRWMTGRQLQTVRRRLYALASRRQTLRGSVHLRPTVTAVRGNRATVQDCQDSSGWLPYDQRGRRLAHGVPRRDLYVATLVLDKERQWKVTSSRITVGGC